MTRIFATSRQLYCEQCKKEVVRMSFPGGSENEIEAFKAEIEGTGNLVLVNPASAGPFSCPSCGETLIEKK